MAAKINNERRADGESTHHASEWPKICRNLLRRLGLHDYAAALAGGSPSEGFQPRPEVPDEEKHGENEDFAGKTARRHRVPVLVLAVLGAERVDTGTVLKTIE